jgi:phosphoenolpyruvate-protein kinase (PTS system EI component)
MVSAKNDLELRGNVETPEEGQFVFSHGGEGVGLYRTGMLFMNRRQMPEEDKHYRVEIEEFQKTQIAIHFPSGRK